MITTRKQHAYTQIRDRLSDGTLLPGDRLTEVALSQQLNVSRVPVREAIGQLVSEGLLDQTPGLGVTVKMPSRREIVEVYELRELLETYSMREAARRIKEQDVAELQDLCDQMRHILRHSIDAGQWTRDDRSAMLKLDSAFHRAIAEVADNRRLVQLLNNYMLLQKMFTYHPQLPSTSTAQTRCRSWGHHCRILRALIRHDGDAAVRFAVDHIRYSREIARKAHDQLKDLVQRDKRAVETAD